MKNRLEIKTKQKYKNIKDKYDLHIGLDVELLFGDTVIAGANKDEIFDAIDIYYDGTIEMWKKMPKGTTTWIIDEDVWSMSYYHNDEDNYIPDKEYEPWIVGYKKITVHCSDGDYDYNPKEDEDNEATSYRVDKGCL